MKREYDSFTIKEDPVQDQAADVDTVVDSCKSIEPKRPVMVVLGDDLGELIN